MFSATVMCGNRLKLWNTMPIRRRTGSGSRPGSLMSSPSSRITPSSIGSSRLMHRSSVLLPEPEAPIRQITCDVADVEAELVEHRPRAEALDDVDELQLHRTAVPLIARRSLASR